MPSEQEAAVLRRFVGHLLEESPPDWTVLFPTHEAPSAPATYFLLHRESRGVDTQTFVVEALERILAQLQSRTERDLIELQGQVRGRVHWSATLKSRLSGDYDPSRFVCREVRRRFDTPENQLLHWLIERLWADLAAVPDVVRNGICYEPVSDQLDPKTVGERLGELEVDLGRLRRHVRLREVSLPTRIDEGHLSRAETSKMEEYSLVARLCRRYRETVEPGTLVGMARLARNALPLPARHDAAGEPWLRLAAAVVRS